MHQMPHIQCSRYDEAASWSVWAAGTKCHKLGLQTREIYLEWTWRLEVWDLLATRSEPKSREACSLVRSSLLASSSWPLGLLEKPESNALTSPGAHLLMPSLQGSGFHQRDLGGAQTFTLWQAGGDNFVVETETSSVRRLERAVWILVRSVCIEIDFAFRLLFLAYPGSQLHSDLPNL